MNRRFTAAAVMVLANALAFAPPAHAAARDSSQALTLFLGLAILVGMVTAVVLYKAAHVKNKLDIDVLDVKKLEVDTTGVQSQIRKKVEQLPVKFEDPENAVSQITKLVEDQTNELLQEIKEEYSVKYQVITQEKNREIEIVRKEYQDVKDRFDKTQKLYEKTETEKKTTEAVVRSIAEGLVVVNQKGEVLLMNPSAEKLLGVEKEKKIGKPILENVPDELMVSMSRDSGEGQEKVIEFKTKDESTRRILRQSTAVIQNENGQTVGMVNVLTDVTKQRELDEIKNKFVSNITHELRTPIVAMQKALTLLQTASAGPLNETQANFLNIVARNLGMLSRLVEDVLDMAKIDSGKMRMKITQARLDKVINDACDALDTWAKSKDIQIARQLDRNLPELPIDPDKITQVLNNLIGNAIKFTPAGGTITVKSGWQADGRKVEVSVADTGVGIAPENMKKLFQRFEQFGDQQGITGTGLGLSIAKEIVERHGGEIRAESTPGKGSTFVFTLSTKPHQAGS
jgi:PAS domain S-box-containing protein